MNVNRTRRTRNSRRSRGAILAEFLLIIPIIILFAFGAIEIGSAYRDRLTVSTALRTGTRVAANAGNDGSADWQSVAALRDAISEIPTANIDRMVIFKANADGTPADVRCFENSATMAGGVTGACNVYTGASLASATAAGFTADSDGSCGSNADKMWCPLGRVPELDMLGVWVSIRHDYVTRLFPSSVTLVDQIVMRLEPEVD